MKLNIVLNAYHKRNGDLTQFDIIMTLPFLNKLRILFGSSTKFTISEPVIINNLKFMEEGKGVI